MDSSAGAGNYRVSGKKKNKNKTYLINWDNTWLSVDARGGGSGR